MPKRTGLGVMTYGSLAYGLLTGTFTEDTTFEEGDWRRTGGLGHVAAIVHARDFQA